jgi:hypothetical protein
MKVGDRVEKRTGYKWPGQIVAVFTTKAGLIRCVVECTHPVVAGALHIYAPEQLARVDEFGWMSDDEIEREEKP